MTHPLTDKIIAERLITIDECLRRVEDGRAMYYEEDFRVGADWQLEQVIEWLDENLCDYDRRTESCPGLFSPMSRLTVDLAKAMRPTTQEDNS